MISLSDVRSLMGGPRQRGPGRSLKDLKRELNVKNERDRLHVKIGPSSASSGTGFEPWTPSPQAALKLLISVRLGSAVWSSVSDCDEVQDSLCIRLISK